MDKNQYIKLIFEWQQIIAQADGVERSYHAELLAAALSKPIKIVTGFRRSGKSFLLQMVANALVKRGDYQLNNILYLNFEDYRLGDIRTIAELDAVIQLFLNEIAEEGRTLLIFDEIQYIPHWDKLMRTLYEKNKNSEIFLTGSNSELLSSEIGTNLAGRFIECKILPFSFAEFLAYHERVIKTEKDFYQHHAEIERLFTAYIRYGGLPEVLTINNKATKYSYLQGVLSKVVLDDIIERFQVRQPKLVEQILHFLYLGVGNIVSSAKLANKITSMGVAIKRDTASMYIDYITKTFAMYAVEKFDWKLNRVFSTSNKYYSVDTGLINLHDHTTNNFSRQLENAVYLKLNRDFGVVYYGQAKNTGKEVDFIVKNKHGQYEKYQVVRTLTVDNRDRELSSFVDADQYLAGAGNVLLTLDEGSDSISYKNSVITQRNLLEWLLLG